MTDHPHRRRTSSDAVKQIRDINWYVERLALFNCTDGILVELGTRGSVARLVEEAGGRRREQFARSSRGDRDVAHNP